MSRIGKEPVVLPAGVTATVDGQKVTVKGKLGELSYVTHSGITALQGTTLSLSIDSASPEIYAIPAGIKVTVENDGLLVTVSGIDKDKVGEAAARIRSFYPAEPYKGKGIKYEGEHIRRKQGKKVA